MELRIETGLQEFNLNGKVTVEFNPSDPEFVKKLYQTFSDLEAKQKDFEEESKNIPEDDADEVFGFAERKDREMKDRIDTFFGKEVCKPLFGNMSVYAFNKDGIPVWMALFVAILDQCDSMVDKLGETGSKTVDKYIKKYQKYKR